MEEKEKKGLKDLGGEKKKKMSATNHLKIGLWCILIVAVLLTFSDPAMAARKVDIVTLEAPTSDPDINRTETFYMNCSWTESGSGAPSDGTMYFEYYSIYSGAWATIPSSDNLTTSDTNPITGTDDGITYPITVTGNRGGVYEVRCRVYDTNNDLNKYSGEQEVTVTPNTNITLSCNLTDFKRGESTNISGKLTDENGTGIADKTVNISFHAGPQTGGLNAAPPAVLDSSWHQIASVTTSSDGSYNTSWTPDKRYAGWHHIKVIFTGNDTLDACFNRTGTNSIPNLLLNFSTCYADCFKNESGYKHDAWPLITIEKGTVTGDVFVCWNKVSGDKSITCELPNGTIKSAYFISGSWGGTEDSGGALDQAKVNGVNVVPEIITGKDSIPGYGGTIESGYHRCGCDGDEWADCGDYGGATPTKELWQKYNFSSACSGCGVHGWALNLSNVLYRINMSETNTFEVLDGSYGFMVIIVYANESLNETQYWINHGFMPLNNHGMNCGGGHESIVEIYHNYGNFTGDINVSVSSATLYFYSLIGHTDPDPLEFNGYQLTNDNADGIPSCREYTVTEHVNTSLQTQVAHHYIEDESTGDYNIRSNVFVLKINAEPGPDLIVEEIEFPTAMRPNVNQTINATIKNKGNENATNLFNVTLYVDNVENGTVNITQLNASKSTTVSFTNVNLSKGCYEFKVVADVNNSVDETHEDNNATTEKYQIGYVIVVKSNSDFDKLVTESNNGRLGTGNVSKIGNTYYIRNFTSIENCAGDGISIENTDDHFVINNCTIENCTKSGVYFRNLSNGTVNGSCLIQNNTEYGINVYGLGDVSNTTLINITNNTIKENGIYGIELIGCNCTVHNNTIRNNTEYGIYLYGNNSNITYNKIKYNDDYGVKVYISSHDNYIYHNNFIENNADNPGHQGYDKETYTHWNTTDTGNYWSDWQDNSGWSEKTYEIDDGSNKDYYPKGLYDFSTGAGTDKWAFRPETPATLSVNEPHINFTDAQYDNIEADDNTRQEDQTSTDTYYAAHRFNFSISESPSSITKINVTWIGIGKHDDPSETDGANLSIWNFTAGDYELLQASADTRDEVTLTGEKTSSISSYIGAGNVTILVNQTSAQVDELTLSYIETDYVKLVITQDP